jgi:beta-barrel assembly-enhancing protease
MSTRELQFLFTAAAVLVICLGGLTVVDWSPHNLGQLNFFSLADDWTIGDQAAGAFAARHPFAQSPKAQAYVTRLGLMLGAVSDEPGWDYRFAVIDDDSINAGAFPGGAIYVNRGLLEAVESEAELAAALGHEIGHVVARHGSEDISREQLIDFLDALRGSIHFSNGLYAGPVKPFRTFSSLVSDLERNSYSRGQEREADGLGLTYVMRANYDPGGMAGLHGRIAATHPNRPMARWLSTHPLSADRIAYARAIALAQPAHLKTRPSSAAFHEMKRELQALSLVRAHTRR